KHADITASRPEHSMSQLQRTKSDNSPAVAHKQNIRMKIHYSILIPIVIIGIVLLPKMQAVVPPPDGGYPGSNTAEGQSALLSLISGTLNTAVGASSLGSVTDGSANTAVGGATLYFNTANENTGTGA